MAQATSTITISAPVHKVYETVANPNRFPEFWTAVQEIKDVEPIGNGRLQWAYAYKMIGLKLHGTSRHVEVDRPRRIVTETSGGIEATVTWELEPEGSGTRVTATAAYKVPVPLLGKLLESAIVKLNQREADSMLANLKILLEA